MTGPSYSVNDDTILLVSDEDRRGREAYRFLMGEGVRVSKPERIETARLDAPGAPVWVELSRSDDAVEDWLSALQSALDGVPATIVVPGTMLDIAAARLDGAEIEILVDPQAAEKLTAVALMQARNRALRAGAREANAADDDPALARLSAEVARIATSLAALTDRRRPGVKASSSQEATEHIEASDVRREIAARRRRYDYFDAGLFSDPAWDMLLELTEADLAGQKVPISSLCMAAAVPPTTALRWIRSMTDRGIFVRRPDALDGRRVFIELEAGARAAMHAYFGASAERAAG